VLLDLSAQTVCSYCNTLTRKLGGNNVAGLWLVVSSPLQMRSISLPETCELGHVAERIEQIARGDPLRQEAAHA